MPKQRKSRAETIDTVIRAVCHSCTEAEFCTHDIYDNPTCVKFCEALENIASGNSLV